MDERLNALNELIRQLKEWDENRGLYNQMNNPSPMWVITGLIECFRDTGKVE